MQENVQLVDKLLDLIEALAQSDKPLGPTALAARTNLSRSTVHRLLGALAVRHYVEKKEAGAYELGPKLIEVVSYYINSLELQTEARPYLHELSSKLGLAAHLGVLDRHEVIYIEKLDVIPEARLYTQIGFRAPAHCSSMGKCLLACLSGDELCDTLSACRFEKYTAHTIPDMPTLRQHLRQVRQQGYALDDEETSLGERCVAAPIFDYRGDVIAAISASGPVSRVTREYMPEVISAVRQAAGKISRRLGYIE